MASEGFNTIGDALKSTAKDVDILKEDVALFKHLINERKHPLDLIRELLSNAGASQVGASRIEVTYTVDKSGHIFEVTDDGCGMDYTGNQKVPGRLDRFLGLGLSAVVGHQSDEFSWKGLGSKLCFQSRRVEVETRHKDGALYNVTINDPWDTINRNLMPRPRISEHQDSDFHGTRIKVYGHPPHRQEQPFSFEEIRTFLLHRTFAAFTQSRPKAPEIYLSVLGQTKVLPFGFGEFTGRDYPDGLHLDRSSETLFLNLAPKSSNAMTVRLKGFLTWKPEQYGLNPDNLNVGLLLSARGIPYFDLDMEEYGARSIVHANPGRNNLCLVAECDAVHSEMNISRSDLIDSAHTLRFRQTVKELIETLEGSPEYLAFRQIPKERRRERGARDLAETKSAIESEEQNWVVWDRPGHGPVVLMREPENEQEALGLLWKLEALGALPFAQFQTLAYPGAGGGPDLIVNFQEDKTSEPSRAAVVEVENRFYNYKAHGHLPAQYPKIVCWDAPSSGRKIRLTPTGRKHKFTANMDEYQLHVFVLRLMEGIRVLSRKEMKAQGIAL